ncbi:sn-glycerol-3-phosphate ABC transporter substrate-binding protein UgpB [Rhodoplanes sp. TEM]|uniref:sn-glycerol-3-phosphate-binding periplasmic protein UgpB n=1 Tax=Rhodoplanes tepidamans TaxID=200616 RepID=A0ABT5JCJ4_RHOTP|nr:MULTISPECIES: sn-glycerol-3-phosphate ABC transporter substrate-binding protein UgpB [Rhodoplanes]MDC7787389.1 sn-glycerol-3-phosphate ABC transporter substrate-binding protein UgpB [Rhodoplanes tepidamans]MDC7985508.1 sn-glycerol-3-phosphate ABC transporter substrate-binding protein UgpB [Rhodoplanes sp. TEM]MDQ0358126.1 sn-glycerol 3-phosphate transport system substrate-binding protein [Rhodoplanes tepidamans]
MSMPMPSGASPPGEPAAPRDSGRAAGPAPDRRRVLAGIGAAIGAGAGATLGAGPARAAIEVQFWHAMAGELGRQIDRVVAGFNSEQDAVRVVPVFKGSYTETVTAAIFAARTQSHPAIVQVNEIGTATMMAARGAVYPLYELMRDMGEPFDAAAVLPPIAGFYSDPAGNLLSYPFNASTPILYFNRDLFRAAGLDDRRPPRTWPEVEEAARRLRLAGVTCGFSTHWPSWVNVENFSAFHDVPLATRANGLAGPGAELTLDNPVLERHVAALAAWQKSGIYAYGGRGTAAEPMLHSGTCGIFIGSSALAADIRAKAKFDVGYGMLPYWPDVPGAPRNSTIGGASLWVLRGRPMAEYRGAARFFAYLARPEVQSRWHQATGYLPVSRAAYEHARAAGFYDRNPGAAIAIEEVTLKPPTDNSRGLRLGSFILVRDVIEEELELAFAGRKTARDALASAVRRGNDLLRQFDRASR